MPADPERFRMKGFTSGSGSSFTAVKRGGVDVIGGDDIGVCADEDDDLDEDDVERRGAHRLS